jgi:hypothetical protein
MPAPPCSTILDIPGDVLKSNINEDGSGGRRQSLRAAICGGDQAAIIHGQAGGILMHRNTEEELGLFQSILIRGDGLARAWRDEIKIFKKLVAVKKTVAIVRAPVTRQGFGQLCLQGR